MPRAQAQGSAPAKSSQPVRSTSSSEGGVMRMTVYFQQAEWDAVRERAAAEDTTMAALVRKAVRTHLNLP